LGDKFLNSLSLYIVHFLMFMGEDGKIINIV
jgi:hypothetical protein